MQHLQQQWIKLTGIAISCINNVSWTGGYQNEFYQVKDVGIIADPNTGFNTDIGSCANVLSAVNTCIGVVTTIIGAGTTGNITANQYNISWCCWCRNKSSK